MVDLDHGGTGGDLTINDRDDSAQRGGVGDDEDRGGVVTSVANHLEISVYQRLTAPDSFTGAHFGGEPLSLEIDGVQADVDEDLHTVVGLDAVGMAGVHGGDDGPRCRCDNVAVGGDDTDSVAEGPGGEDRVGDVLQRHGGSVHR